MSAAVHKALRHAGARVLMDLGTCAGDLVAVERAVRATRELLVLHEIHQRVEDQFVIPALEAKRRGAAARLVDAHTDHEDHISRLRARLSVVELDPTRASLHALYLEVTRFLGDAFLHMYEEEVLAQALLEEVYPQAELASLAQRARDSLTPHEHELFAGHFLSSMSHADRQGRSDSGQKPADLPGPGRRAGATVPG